MAIDVHVLCCGEVLVDVAPGPDGAPVRRLGGAPANVAVALARMGVAAGFAGCAGADADGDLCVARLTEEGVDLTHLQRGGDTPVATVTLPAGGERSFAFDRGSDPADLRWRYDGVGEARVVVGAGSLVTGGEPARQSLLAALEAAPFAVFDLNLRPHLFGGVAAAAAAAHDHASAAKLLRGNLEEARALLGDRAGDDPAAAARALAAFCRGGAGLVTDGAAGAWWALHLADGTYRVGAVDAAGPPGPVVDTTGAGDTFVAGTVAALLGYDLDLGALPSALVFAATAAAAATTAFGGADSTPRLRPPG